MDDAPRHGSDRNPAAAAPSIHELEEEAELIRRFEESMRRSRTRRRLRRRRRVRRRLRRRDLARSGPFGRSTDRGRNGPWAYALGFVTGLVVVLAGAIFAGPWLVDTAGDRRLDLLQAKRASQPEGQAESAPAPGDGQGEIAPRRRNRGRVPTTEAFSAARSFAREREGLVSFAAVDSRGRMHGLEADRRFVSASVVKAMLLAAELERLRAEDAPLDDTTRSLLTAMITYSDNAAADSIYYRVGDPGLFAVAKRAGMRDFTVSGYWANAQISARDMAAFMERLDRILVGPYADVGAGLLAAIVPEQSWGIPEATPEGWRARFKGGWRTTELGALVHQVARLEPATPSAGPGGVPDELALAVLTDGQPSQDYGIETVRGIAERLLAPVKPRPDSDRASDQGARPESGRGSRPRED
jgi:Beta-lactamase enzyme family